MAGGLFGALMAPRRKSLSGSVGSELFGPFGGGTSAGVPVNAISGLHYGPLLTCCNIISEDLAKLPVGMFRARPNGGKEQVRDHYLARLLVRPNSWQNRLEFFEMMTCNLLLRGNAYACIIRNDRGFPEQLIPIHPDRVGLREAPGGWWFYYVARAGLHEMAALEPLPIMIANEDMFVIRWQADPQRSLLGMDRLSLLRESIGIGLAMEQHLARTFGQAARPGGVLMVSGNVNPERFNQIQAKWQESHGGWRNGGKTAILEGGMTWQQVEMSLEAIEFSAARDYELRAMARCFRLPLHKLGLQGDQTPQNLVQMETLYWNDCVSIYADRWALKLEELGDLDGVNRFVQFDYSRILAADVKTSMDVARAGVGSGILSINDARRQLGYPDDPLGDTLLVPSGMVPLGTYPGGQGQPGSNTTGRPAPGGDGDPSAAGDQPLSDN